MSGLIEVIDGGTGNSIQDCGRFGYRHLGVAVSGCLDSFLARCANALVGNAPECACLEIRGNGPKLLIRHGRIHLALAGDLSAVLRRCDGSLREVPAWSSVTLFPHEQIEVDRFSGGTAYLSVYGGIVTPPQLDSRSTYARALLGGIDGHLLRAGDLLPCASQAHLEYHEYHAAPWCYEAGPMRVLPGPQDTHFTEDARHAFYHSAFRVTPRLDRLGICLEGPLLAHGAPDAVDIVSDGVAPGSVQVQASGQAIVLLADGQTVGGYPKIANVISADLPRLAQLRVDDELRFSAVSLHEAQAALLAREAAWEAWVAGIAFGLPNVSALYNDLTGVWATAD